MSFILNIVVGFISILIIISVLYFFIKLLFWLNKYLIKKTKIDLWFWFLIILAIFLLGLLCFQFGENILGGFA